MEPAHGPTMPRIARACRIRTPLCPAVTEATCARICNRAEVPHRRNLAASPLNPQPPSEWAIGKSPGALPTRTAVLSAGFGRAARRARKATMDIPASVPPAAAAEAPRAGAEGRPAGVVAAGAEERPAGVVAAA